MVLDAINESGERIFANNSSKGLFTCSYCKKKIFFVKKSIDGKCAHFRHEQECDYSNKFNENYIFYIDDFHYKWTTDLVNIKYLYKYWNIELYDIITPNKDLIVVRKSLLKKKYYENDNNIIWILDGTNRIFDISEIIYDDENTSYNITSNKSYEY